MRNVLRFILFGFAISIVVGADQHVTGTDESLDDEIKSLDELIRLQV